MRFLDKLISFIFSLVFLALAIVLILIGVGVIEPQVCIELLKNVFIDSNVLSQGIFNPVTITGVILLLLALKTTVFLSLFKVRHRTPISVKTQNGEIQIAQETIINTAKNQTLEFPNVKEVQASMVKKSKGIVIYEVIQVYVNTNIRTLTEAIQNSVKEIVLATTGVSVVDVNIKVRNVYNGKRKLDDTKTENDVEKEDKKEEVVVEAQEVEEVKLEEKVVEEVKEEKEENKKAEENK